jgi:hypothetical protein
MHGIAFPIFSVFPAHLSFLSSITLLTNNLHNLISHIKYTKFFGVAKKYCDENNKLNSIMVLNFPRKSLFSEGSCLIFNSLLVCDRSESLAHTFGVNKNAKAI